MWFSSFGRIILKSASRVKANRQKKKDHINLLKIIFNILNKYHFMNEKRWEEETNTEN